MNENSEHAFGSMNFRTAINCISKFFKQSEKLNNDRKIARVLNGQKHVSVE